MTGRELKLLGNDLAELTPYLDAGAERLIDEAEFYATNTVQLVKALQRGAQVGQSECWRAKLAHLASSRIHANPIPPPT